MQKLPFSFALSLILIFIYFLVFVNIAYGHSVPDSYSLGPNTILESSNAFPANLTIIFSERPDPKVSYIHVTDSEGNRLDDGNFKITGENERQATVFLDTNKVHDGVYSISWLTLSKDDGHIAKGTYVMGVGAITNLTQTRENIVEQQETLTPIIAVIKTPIIISQVCILGIVVCDLLVWRGIPRTESRNATHELTRSRFRKVIILSASAIAAAATILLFIQAYDVTESGSDYIKNLNSLLYETSSGAVWIARIVCSAVVLVVIFNYSRVTTSDAKSDGLRDIVNRKMILLSLLLIATIASIATNSIVSHSATIQSAPQLAIISDFIHFSAVSIWVGGLVYLSYVFLPNITRISSNIAEKVQQIVAQPDSMSLLTLSRFSTVASASLGAIGITGLYLAWIHINSVEDLLYSDYGKVLIIKLSIALPVLLLGAYHQFWIRKIFNKLSLSGGDKQQMANHNKIINDKLFSSIRFTIKFEAILAICILCAAAFLTVTPLPVYQEQVSTQNISKEQSSSVPKVQSKFVQDLVNQGIPMTLTISPFHVGFNNFTVSIPEASQNSSQISSVFTEFKKSDGSLGPIIARLQKINSGAYSTIGGYLSQPGQWNMKIMIQRMSAYDLNYRLTETLNNAVSTSSGSEHMNMNMSMDSTLSDNQGKPARVQFFTYLFGILGTVVASLSFVFYVQAKKNNVAIQKYLGNIMGNGDKG